MSSHGAGSPPLSLVQSSMRNSFRVIWQASERLCTCPCIDENVFCRPKVSQRGLSACVAMYKAGLVQRLATQWAHPEAWQAQKNIQAAHIAQAALAQADVTQLPQHGAGHVRVAPQLSARVQPQLLQ